MIYVKINYQRPENRRNQTMHDKMVAIAKQRRETQAKKTNYLRK